MGASLRRVRVADRPLEGGGKKVWHQAEGGAEVISFVDPEGNATRQECYLGEQVIVWQADLPVTTGLVKDESSGGDSIEPDLRANVSAVLNAVALLEGFHGEDKYLEHLRAVLRLAAQKLPVTGLDPSEVAALRRVTAEKPAVTPEELAEHAQANAPKRAWLPWAFVAAAAVAALAGWFAQR
jgi:hypothetical protein